MWRKLYIPLILSALLLFPACAMPRETPPQPKAVGIRTTPEQPKVADAQNTPVQPKAIRGDSSPDLAAGPESKKRSTDYQHVSQLAQKFPNIVYYSGPQSLAQKQVALTFDDGPDTDFTPKILDVLRKNNVKATFFIVGKRAAAHPEMVKLIAAEGHAIGNHTWDHPDLVKLTPDQIKSEIDRTEQQLHSILGYLPSLFRPPYGAATHNDVAIIAALGYKVIDWSVDTRDWAGVPVATIMDNVHKEVKPGGIILEHCAGGKGEDLNNTVQALPQIIAYLRANGYTFVTVPQMINTPLTRKTR